MKQATMTGYQGMVVSPHDLASECGFDILQRGGSAADAAIAMSAVLGVVYPHMTGIGGDAFAIVYDASEKKLTSVNGSGGAAGNIDVFNANLSVPVRGPLSAITVPGVVDSWWQLWQRYGRLEWTDLLEPAIKYAEQGFPVSRHLHYCLNRDSQYLNVDPEVSRIFLPGGRVPQQGERLYQKDLADTLRLLQKDGRDTFYQGELMQTMVALIKQAGGILGEEDFIRHNSEWTEVLRSGYRGYEICVPPPNSQGFTLLMMLNALENYRLSDMDRISPDFYHLAAEITKAVLAEKEKHLSDPRFHDMPLQQLLSKSYGRVLADSVPWEAAPARATRDWGDDTAYTAVYDREGNAVSMIQSIYYAFGSTFMPKNTGILMHNRGHSFSLREGDPHVLKPGKRPPHTLMPSMVLQDDLPVLLLGSQGGEGQPQTVLSILTGVIDYGLGVDEAMNLPRWLYGKSFHDKDCVLRLEDRVDEAVFHELERRGHEVRRVKPWDYATGQAGAILINRRDGSITGSADLRSDGIALGW
jgi:gamma-glutamyltranspeptidase/glutathione hydrolase